MYTPRHFEVTDIGRMHVLIRDNPLAALVTTGIEGLTANHVPFVLSPDPTPFGTLLGHVARANSVWKEAAKSQVLAIFHGPEAYISPNWYATKAETGKVVPTWNYAVVHTHGVLRIHDDPAWVRTQIEALTNQNEATQPAPWAVSDAPAEYIEKLIQAIVGIEIVISRLEGKWKVSQNQPEANRTSVVDGLGAFNSENGKSMIALIEASAPTTRGKASPQN